MSETRCRCGHREAIHHDNGVCCYDHGMGCACRKFTPNKPAEPSPEVAPTQQECGAVWEKMAELGHYVCAEPRGHTGMHDTHGGSRWENPAPAVAPRETQTYLQTRIKQLRYAAERAISQGKDEVQIDAMELLQFVARLEEGGARWIS